MGKKKRYKKLVFPFVLGLFLTLLAIYGFKGDFITAKPSSIIRRSLLMTSQQDDISMTQLNPSEFLSPSIPPVLGSTNNAPRGSIGLAPSPAAQNHSPNNTKNDTRISPTNEMMPPVHSATESPAQPPTSQVTPPPVTVQPPLNPPPKITVPAGPPMHWRSPVSSVSPVSSPPRNLSSSHLSPTINSTNNDNNNNNNNNTSRPVIPSLPPLHVSPPPKKLPSPLSSPKVPIAVSPVIPAASPPVKISSPPLLPVNNSSNKAPVPVQAPPKEISSHLSPSKHATSPVPSSSPVRQRKRDRAPVAPPPKEERTGQSHRNISHKGQGPVISPAPQQAQNAPAPSRALIPKNNHKHRSSPPFNHGPSISPSPVHPPNGENNQVPSPSPIISPTGKNNQVPSPSPVISPTGENNQIPSPSPVISPTGENNQVPSTSPSPVRSSPFIHHKHKRPAPVPAPAPIQPETIVSLPPPPPNLYCTPLSCAEPFTNSPSSPGSPCTCVLPIKVGLRLSVSLYNFFTLVSSLASELSAGLKLTQSQVRVMGANSAAADAGQEGNEDKTDVLVDLVPVGTRFDGNTGMWVYERFWRKEVAINGNLFGDYEVLYVDYPGLPPSPPVGTGTNNGKNSGISEHPLAADVRKNKEKQKGSIIAIIVLSSVFALILLGGAIWFLVLKLRGRLDRSNSSMIVGTLTSKPSSKKLTR